MRWKIQRGLRSVARLSVSALRVGGRQVTPFASLQLPPSAPLVDMQPCCESEQIPDLYAAPHRGAAK